MANRPEDIIFNLIIEAKGSQEAQEAIEALAGKVAESATNLTRLNSELRNLKSSVGSIQLNKLIELSSQIKAADIQINNFRKSLNDLSTNKSLDILKNNLDNATSAIKSDALKDFADGLKQVSNQSGSLARSRDVLSSIRSAIVNGSRALTERLNLEQRLGKAIAANAQQTARVAVIDQNANKRAIVDLQRLINLRRGSLSRTQDPERRERGEAEIRESQRQLQALKEEADRITLSNLKQDLNDAIGDTARLTTAQEALSEEIRRQRVEQAPRRQAELDATASAQERGSLAEIQARRAAIQNQLQNTNALNQGQIALLNQQLTLLNQEEQAVRAIGSAYQSNNAEVARTNTNLREQAALIATGRGNTQQLEQASEEYTQSLEEQLRIQDRINQETAQARIEASRRADAQRGGGSSLRTLQLQRSEIQRQINVGDPRQVTRLRQELAQLNAQINRISGNRGSVGFFNTSLGRGIATAGRLAGSLAAIGFAVSQLIRPFIKATQIAAEFEQKIADVRAVSGAAGEEFALLRENAISLAGATQFTGAQVAELQKQFAKLGFDAQEIVDATGATINLATAIGEDLNQAATVTGTVVRTFQLDTAETGRVVDTLTKSFNTSALDLEKFFSSLKFVGPVAKAAGLSLEQTTGILSELANAGISGTRAGTSLRRILTELSTEGSKLLRFLGVGAVKDADSFARALDALATKNIDAATSFDLVGRVAQSALITISSNVGAIEQYNEALNNAAGTAERTAAIQRDTLQKSFEVLKSAFERFAIEVGDTFIPVLKPIVDGITDFVNTINESIGTQEDPIVESFTAFTGYSIRILALTRQLEGLSTASSEYIRIQKELNILIQDASQNSAELREFFENRQDQESLFLERFRARTRTVTLDAGRDAAESFTEGFRQELLDSVDAIGGDTQSLLLEGLTAEELISKLFKEGNLNAEERRKILQEINDGPYADLIRNAEDLLTLQEDLTEKVAETNEEYIRSLRERAKLAALAEEEAAFTEAQENVFDIQIEQTKLLSSLQANAGKLLVDNEELLKDFVRRGVTIDNESVEPFLDPKFFSVAGLIEQGITDVEEQSKILSKRFSRLVTLIFDPLRPSSQKLLEQQLSILLALSTSESNLTTAIEERDAAQKRLIFTSESLDQINKSNIISTTNTSEAIKSVSEELNNSTLALERFNDQAAITGSSRTFGLQVLDVQRSDFRDNVAKIQNELEDLGISATIEKAFGTEFEEGQFRVEIQVEEGEDIDKVVEDVNKKLQSIGFQPDEFQTNFLIGENLISLFFEGAALNIEEEREKLLGLASQFNLLNIRQLEEQLETSQLRRFFGQNVEEIFEFVEGDVATLGAQAEQSRSQFLQFLRITQAQVEILTNAANSLIPVSARENLEQFFSEALIVVEQGGALTSEEFKKIGQILREDFSSFIPVDEVRLQGDALKEEVDNIFILIKAAVEREQFGLATEQRDRIAQIIADIDPDLITKINLGLSLEGEEIDDELRSAINKLDSSRKLIFDRELKLLQESAKIFSEIGDSTSFQRTLKELSVVGDDLTLNVSQQIKRRNVLNKLIEEELKNSIDRAKREREIADLLIEQEFILSSQTSGRFAERVFADTAAIENFFDTIDATIKEQRERREELSEETQDEIRRQTVLAEEERLRAIDTTLSEEERRRAESRQRDFENNIRVLNLSLAADTKFLNDLSQKEAEYYSQRLKAREQNAKQIAEIREKEFKEVIDSLNFLIETEQDILRKVDLETQKELEEERFKLQERQIENTIRVLKELNLEETLGLTETELTLLAEDLVNKEQIDQLKNLQKELQKLIETGADDAEIQEVREKINTILTEELNLFKTLQDQLSELAPEADTEAIRKRITSLLILFSEISGLTATGDAALEATEQLEDAAQAYEFFTDTIQATEDLSKTRSEIAETTNRLGELEGTLLSIKNLSNEVSIAPTIEQSIELLRVVAQTDQEIGFSLTETIEKLQTDSGNAEKIISDFLQDTETKFGELGLDFTDLESPLEKALLSLIKVDLSSVEAANLEDFQIPQKDIDRLKESGVELTVTTTIVPQADVDANAVDLLAKESAVLLNNLFRQATKGQVTITSGFRDTERNVRAGGVDTSLHKEGRAVDIAKDPAFDFLINNQEAWDRFGIEEFIPYSTHYHIGFKSKEDLEKEKNSVFNSVEEVNKFQEEIVGLLTGPFVEGAARVEKLTEAIAKITTETTVTRTVDGESTKQVEALIKEEKEKLSRLEQQLPDLQQALQTFINEATLTEEQINDLIKFSTTGEEGNLRRVLETIDEENRTLFANILKIIIPTAETFSDADIQALTEEDLEKVGDVADVLIKFIAEQNKTFGNIERQKEIQIGLQGAIKTLTEIPDVDRKSALVEIDSLDLTLEILNNNLNNTLERRAKQLEEAGVPVQRREKILKELEEQLKFGNLADLLSTESVDPTNPFNILSVALKKADLDLNKLSEDLDEGITEIASTVQKLGLGAETETEEEAEKRIREALNIDNILKAITNLFTKESLDASIKEAGGDVETFIENLLTNFDSQLLKVGEEFADLTPEAFFKLVAEGIGELPDETKKQLEEFLKFFQNIGKKIAEANKDLGENIEVKDPKDKKSLFDTLFGDGPCKDEQRDIDKINCIVQIVANVAKQVTDVIQQISDLRFQRELNNIARERELSDQRIQILNQELQQKSKFLEEFYDEEVVRQADAAERELLIQESRADALERAEVAIRRRQFEVNKKFQIANATIEGARAVVSALTNQPIALGIALALIAATSTAVQIARIRATRFEGKEGLFLNPEEFAKGGTLSDGTKVISGGSIPDRKGIIRGRRHSSNENRSGVKAITKDGKYIEVEGGEITTVNGKTRNIFTRGVTQNPTLRKFALSTESKKFDPVKAQLASVINQLGGGVSYSGLKSVGDKGMINVPSMNTTPIIPERIIVQRHILESGDIIQASSNNIDASANSTEVSNLLRGLTNRIDRNTQAIENINVTITADEVKTALDQNDQITSNI